jgi:hypothetical protein
VYNEKLSDLLMDSCVSVCCTCCIPSSWLRPYCRLSSDSLTLRQIGKDVVVAGLSEYRVTCLADVMALLRRVRLCGTQLLQWW